MGKERKGQKTGEDRSHLSFLIKGRDGCRKLFAVACLRGFLSVWGHSLTWPPVFSAHYYTTA